MKSISVTQGESLERTVQPPLQSRNVTELGASRVALRLLGDARAVALVQRAFSVDHYLRQLRPDTKVNSTSKEHLILHFLERGMSQLLSPSPLLDLRYYVDRNHDVRDAGVNAIVHFVGSGCREKRNPCLFFDTGYYYEQLGIASADDLGRVLGGLDPVSHYLMNWRETRISPCPYIDVDVYMSSIGSDLEGAADPISHYLEHGWRTPVRTCDIFDNGFYATKHRDVAQLEIPPLKHFIEWGIREGRVSAPEFDAIFYESSLYPVACSAPPAEHYAKVGRSRGYLPGPNVAPRKTPNPALQHRATNPCKVAVGVVLYRNSEQELRRLVASVKQEARSQQLDVSLLFLPNDNEDIAMYSSRLATAECGTSICEYAGNLGFGRGHNMLMAEAFGARDCNYYVGVNPDGLLTGDTLRALTDFSNYWDDRALIEAVQFPVEHPKWFNPVSFDTGWVSGACFLLPRGLWAAGLGFDEAFELYCEDVDLSWAARASGFHAKVCPTAVFYHDTSDREGVPNKTRRKSMLLAARKLAHKWRNETFRREIEGHLIRESLVDVPSELPALADVPQVEHSVVHTAEFRHLLYFSPARY